MPVHKSTDGKFVFILFYSLLYVGVYVYSNRYKCVSVCMVWCECACCFLMATFSFVFVFFAVCSDVLPPYPVPPLSIHGSLTPRQTKNNSCDTIVCVHLFIIMYSYILMKFVKAALSQQHTKILYSLFTRNVVFIKGLMVWQSLPPLMQTHTYIYTFSPTTTKTTLNLRQMMCSKLEKFEFMQKP